MKASELPAQLYPCHVALTGADRSLRLMARTLDWLTQFVPAAAATFYRVDARLQALSTGPVVFKLMPPDLLDPVQGYRTYLGGYRELDPLAPRAFATSVATVVGSADLKGNGAFGRSRFAREYLAHLGLGPHTAIFLRDETRIVAAVTLARKLGDKPLSDVQVEFLRRSQPLLQEAYLIARRSGGRDPGKFLRARGLTGRQVEVALLVASGAGNDEIAALLSISNATVKSHLHRIFKRLGVRSRTQLVLLLGSSAGEDGTLGPG